MAGKYVLDGAKIRCPLCTEPEGTLVVTSNQIQIQDKFWATAADKSKANLVFKGNCTKWSKNPPPCASVISAAKWEKTAETFVDGNKALIEDSCITCNTGNVPIKIADTAQTASPTDIPEEPEDVVEKVVFLTFDDGVQAGTKEVLAILKEEGVKGTFFLTGVHTNFSYLEDKESTLALLKDIYENHAIANHSYSHANYFYTAYYRNGGVKVDNYGTRRSVIDDFIKNEEVIASYLKEIDDSYDETLLKGKSQAGYAARLPGTNSWYVNETLKDIKSTNRGDTFSLPQRDSQNETEALYERGYKVYGWDVEWHMTFDLAGVTRGEIAANEDPDFSNDQEAHPDDIDLYATEYANMDRLTDSWIDVRDQVLDFAHQSKYQLFDDVAKTEGNVVLLMHERAFRNGADGSSAEADKLRQLIKGLTSLGFTFKTIDKY